MLDFQEILDEPEIADYLQTHQGVAPQVRRAAEVLDGKPDAVDAVKKLFPALSEKVVNVFFSYKKKDERAARAVVDILRINSAEKLRITYQAEFTEEIAGKAWRKKIREAVSQANWFILLLPDPSDDWDWCLYETGLFDRQPTSADRLICLHHPDIPIPSPIEDYHAVPANVADVEKFLRMVYVHDNPIPGMAAINRSIEPQIGALAEKIVEAIRPPTQALVRRIFEPWVELAIDNAAGLQCKDELDQALIVSANEYALDLFDFMAQPKTWGDLRVGIAEQTGDGRWREELFHVVRKIANGRKFYPIQAVFQSPDGKMYRPVACAIDRLGEEGRIHSYHVTFTEDVGAVDATSMPSEMSALATILRFTFRFRWEVLERFGVGTMTDSDIERLENALRRIRVDWDSRGGGDAEMIIGLFAPEKSQRVAQMFAEWHKATNAERTGELDLALEKKDTKQIPAILNKFLPISQEFLEMATDRFSELIYTSK